MTVSLFMRLILTLENASGKERAAPGFLQHALACGAGARVKPLSLPTFSRNVRRGFHPADAGASIKPLSLPGSLRVARIFSSSRSDGLILGRIFARCANPFFVAERRFDPRPAFL